jgi:hypothetical protein
VCSISPSREKCKKSISDECECENKVEPGRPEEQAAGTKESGNCVWTAQKIFTNNSE